MSAHIKVASQENTTILAYLYLARYPTLYEHGHGNISIARRFGKFLPWSVFLPNLIA